tara:strand:- start:5227 stop:6237 length:1011 start_codon:yes stop_codon:yes gene_type:complete
MAVIKKDYTGWVLMAIAVMLGLGAFFLIRQYLGGEEARLRDEALKSRGKLAPVIVAKASLPAGSVIGKATMSIGELPSRHISARMVRPDDFPQVEHRVLNRPMSAGEPLIADFVSGLVVNRFSELLAEGTRAISVEVSALESHSGLLIPGDYIDLFVQLPIKDSRDKRLVGLYERVKILAAGPSPLRTADQAFQPLSEKGASYNLITVSLPADDAENLLRAREKGEIVYLLRGAADETLQFAASGIPRFGDTVEAPEDEAPAVVGGYAYYSPAVPRGERRLRYGASDKASLDELVEDDGVFFMDDDPMEHDEAYLRRVIQTPVRPRESSILTGNND